MLALTTQYTSLIGAVVAATCGQGASVAHGRYAMCYGLPGVLIARGDEGALFFLLVVVALFIGFMFAAQQKARTASAFTLLAEHYRGTYIAGGLLSQPKVRFTHGGARVLVDTYSTGGKNSVSYTQVHVYGHLPDVRCEVYPEGTWSRLGRLIGMGDVEVGSSEFDDRYIIKGDSTAALCKLLVPEVRVQIERLRLLLGNDDIYVSFNRRELLVKKLSIIRDYEPLAELTELAIGLYDLTLQAPGEGIEFVERSASDEAPEAICQICGEPITSQTVICRRCKTPHHRDCWDYYGGCSTYGCGETRYVLPKPRRGRKRAKTRGQRRGKDGARQG